MLGDALHRGDDIHVLEQQLRVEQLGVAIRLRGARRGGGSLDQLVGLGRHKKERHLCTTTKSKFGTEKGGSGEKTIDS
jgi:hypothetical protein